MNKKLTVFKKTSKADGLPTIEHFFVGTDFLDNCKGKLPHSVLEHIGFGDFKLVVPMYGAIFFYRMDKKIDGIVGRQHRMTDNREDYLIDKLITAMDVVIKNL